MSTSPEAGFCHRRIAVPPEIEDMDRCLAVLTGDEFADVREGVMADGGWAAEAIKAIDTPAGLGSVTRAASWGIVLQIPGLAARARTRAAAQERGQLPFEAGPTETVEVPA